MEYYLQFSLVIACVAIGTYVILSRKPSTKSQKSPSYALKGANEIVLFKLKEVIRVTHNTKIFRFSFPEANQVLGLPIGKHFTTHATINGEEVSRPYTPTTSDDEIGYVDLLIKVYDKGLMSQHINNLKIGEDLTVMGPKGLVVYLGKGAVHYSGKGRREFKNINMICGGTGITPMLQIIRAIQKDSSDTTKISLIFGNVSEDDILLREELEQLSKDERFKIFFTLDKPSEDWTYGRGYVTKEMISAEFY